MSEIAGSRILDSRGCECGPNYVHWIYRLSHECMYGSTGEASFILGCASIGFWMITQLPQMIQNYRSGKADGLAGWFVLQWALGDSCNLIGCLLTGQQAITETYTAIYFIFCDILMGSQYLYLRWRSRRERRLKRMIKKSFYSNSKKRDGDGIEDCPYDDDFPRAEKGGLLKHASFENGKKSDDYDDDDDDDVVSSASSSNSSLSFSRPLGAAATIVSTSLCMVTTKAYVDPKIGALIVKFKRNESTRRNLLSKASGCATAAQNRIGFIIAGQTFGYVSVLFYIGSRFAQIHRNYKRKSVEGLNIAMFVFAVMANLTYATAVILAGREQATLFSRLPWLLGSLGTVALDFIIFTQSYIYGDGCEYSSASEATTSARNTPGGAMSRSASTESTALLIKQKDISTHNGSRIIGSSNAPYSLNSPMTSQGKVSPILFSPPLANAKNSTQFSPVTVMYDPLVSSTETTATDESG